MVIYLKTEVTSYFLLKQILNFCLFTLFRLNLQNNTVYLSIQKRGPRAALKSHSTLTTIYLFKLLNCAESRVVSLSTTGLNHWNIDLSERSTKYRLWPSLALLAENTLTSSEFKSNNYTIDLLHRFKLNYDLETFTSAPSGEHDNKLSHSRLKEVVKSAAR